MLLVVMQMEKAAGESAEVLGSLSRVDNKGVYFRVSLICVLQCFVVTLFCFYDNPVSFKD